ncbi:MAG: sugar kinase [Actinomycetota bacterium]
MSGDVLVVGDLMTDVVTRVDDPLSLGSDTAATVRTRRGGAGGNVAAWLAAQGVSCSFVGRVGDDPFGREAVAALRSAGVTTLVGVDPHVATGACVVLVGRDGERTMLPDAGANSTLSPDDLPLDELSRARHLHVSGYTLLNPGSRSAGTAALSVARAAGVGTSVDASSAAPLEAVGSAAFVAMTRDVDLLFVTLDEAAVLCDSRDPAVVAARLTAHYPQVVLKLGGSGAWWCADGRPTRTAAAVPASGDVVDTTGAGDAFAAGYLAATLTGADVDAALAGGCRLGAAAVTRHGARP